jgi:preprotein translocase subunit SecD
VLNTYSKGKYILVALVLAFGFLYAAPNLYGEDHAVQVKARRDAVVTVALMDKVQDALAKENIGVKSASLENKQILVRLLDGEQQTLANEIIATAIGNDYISAPNLAPATPDWLEAVGGAPLKLGLDLRGGVHFLMEIDMKTAINKSIETTVGGFRSDLREEKIRYRTIKRVSNADDINLVFRDEDSVEQARQFLRRRYQDMTFTDKSDASSFMLQARLTEAKIKSIKKSALTQNISVIRNRVNEIGVAEPLVAQQGAERIVVQLPGIQDTAQAKKILGETSTLRFHMVDSEHDVRDAINGRVPGGSILVKQRQGGHLLLKKRVMLSGEYIVGAQPTVDEYSSPQVSIELDAKGGNKFSAATKSAIGKRMAVVLIESIKTTRKDREGKAIYENSEQIITAPTIQARLGRQFRITGLEPQESRDLALILRAGAMVAPAHIVEERTVGPSLGKENIARGLSAVMYGFVAILIFMVVYYNRFGLVANLALGANLVLIVGIMSLMPGATLTLPGIAGIVLTVGMAVDANVLIFERIREEIREGRSIQQAIHHGYDSAFSTIFDANVTTLIAAVILYGIGTGPIKGFAITLSIGIVTSMFTAIIGTRAVVNAAWGGRKLDKLPI